MGHLHETDREAIERRQSLQFIGTICQQERPGRASEMDRQGPRSDGR